LSKPDGNCHFCAGWPVREKILPRTGRANLN
jgi:hypothetical protein